MPVDYDSIRALKNIISQVDVLIATTDPMPENRTPLCRELLRAADALADDVLKQFGKSPALVA